MEKHSYPRELLTWEEKYIMPDEILVLFPKCELRKLVQLDVVLEEGGIPKSAVIRQNQAFLCSGVSSLFYSVT